MAKLDIKKQKLRQALRERRAKAFKRLLRQFRYDGPIWNNGTPDDSTAAFSVKSYDQITYDELHKLSSLLLTKNINLSGELEDDGDTYGPSSSAGILISVRDVDWSIVDFDPAAPLTKKKKK